MISANTDTLRPTPPDAAEAVAVLLAACDDPETVEAVHSQWAQPGFDRAADSCVAGPPAGPLMAYGLVWARDPAEAAEQRFQLGLYVHPDQRSVNPALAEALLAWLEARAHARLAAGAPGATGLLLCSLPGSDGPGQALLTNAGYLVEGELRHMRIELAAPVPTPVWPAGATLRPMRPGDDEPALYALMNETFSDLPDFRPVTYDRWLTRTHPPSFDPRWWFVVDGRDGGVSAAALCFREPHAGWVYSIGVRRAWRRQGLALALLHHAFAEFQRAGLPAVELGVDAANATGAPRVYERAGMHIAQRFVRFYKSISISKELP